MEQLCKMLQQMTNGIATFSNLKPNTYILVEIATNEDYIIDTTEHKIEVGYDVTITKEYKDFLEEDEKVISIKR